MRKKHLPVDFWVMVGMAVVLLVPFTLTLQTISEPRILLSLDANPTPYGYTWSLSLFIVPVIVLATWLGRRPENRLQNRAFWFTTLIVAGSGVLLDTFFGASFFTFPNPAATLGIHFHGYSPANGWGNKIPIEEVGFYIFGSLTVLLVYIWGDEYWFGAYNVDDTARREKTLRDVISFHPSSCIFGVVIFSLGLLYKRYASHVDHEGFPGYFLFLTLVALTPSILFFPVASPFINWRAFSLGFIFMLLVSLFWEATIAVPYQWWGFQHQHMLGLFVNGFSGLPVEEPLLWAGVTWATIIVYETMSTLLFMRGARAASKGIESV